MLMDNGTIRLYTIKCKNPTNTPPPRRRRRRPRRWRGAPPPPWQNRKMFLKSIFFQIFYTFSTETNILGTVNAKVEPVAVLVKL